MNPDPHCFNCASDLYGSHQLGYDLDDGADECGVPAHTIQKVKLRGATAPENNYGNSHLFRAEQFLSKIGKFLIKIGRFSEKSIIRLCVFLEKKGEKMADLIRKIGGFSSKRDCVYSLSQ